MPRFDVNLSILFGERPLLERPAAAAAKGFTAVELWWPFAEPVPPQAAVDALVDSIASAGLTLACLNFDGGDFGAGRRGLVSEPGCEARFRANVPVAIEIARRLDCHVLNALFGNRPVAATTGPAAEREPDRAVCDRAVRSLAVRNLAFAAHEAAAIDAAVVVEALNPVEYPAYGLHSVDEAAAVAHLVRRETGADIGLLFDAYHVARTGEDVISAFHRQTAAIRHVQLADVPGRGKPGTGTLDFAAILGELDESGYTGWVGLEYRCEPGSEDPFDWLLSSRSVA